MPDDTQNTKPADQKTNVPPVTDDEASLDALAEKLSKWKEQMNDSSTQEPSTNQGRGNNRPEDGQPMVDVPASQPQDQTITPVPEVKTEEVVPAVESIPSNPTPQNTPAEPVAPVPEQPVEPVPAPAPEPIKEVPASETKVDLPGQTVAEKPQDVVNESGMDKLEQDIAQATAIHSKTYPKNIKKLLELAKERDASDLHISVGYPPTLRVHGKLVPIGKEVVTADMSSKLILPILAESKKDLLEVNREVDVAYELADVARFRVNVYHEKGRMAAAFRLIPSRIKTLEELNLPKILRRFTKMNQGFVLITGPTGHGKTTTLAALLQEINKNYDKHIITIEDPIEYVYPPAKSLVTQREMHEDTHSWEIALRSAMREDPDVVLVGEMRDFETISSAITLAETGHLVFATLHTNNAPQSIDRIIDTFPDNQQRQVRSQLASIIEGVVTQRLVPVRTGGRMPACEIMLSNAAVKNLIREGKIFQIDNVIRTSLDVGMTSMENSLVHLVREGLISVEQAEEYATYPEEVIRLLR